MPERPHPTRPPDDAICWLDFTTGTGLDPAGQPITPILGGRRKKPNLFDLIETARYTRATMVILCGDIPTGYSWLLPTQTQIAKGTDLTPGWVDTGHYLGDPPRGRFLHTETKHRLTLSTTREWFGDQTLTPPQARFSHQALTSVVATSIDRPDWGLMRSPSATGLNIWKLRFDNVRDFEMEPLPRDIGELIQATDPQHRNEHYVAGPGRCDCGDCLPLMPAGEIPGFTYADGRFMYQGVAKGFRGSAPAWMLTGPQAQALFTSGDRQKSGLYKGAFHPARYRVRYRIPQWWDHIGLFPIKLEGAGRGWHWPNRPGFEGETWINNAELQTAILEGGWEIEFLEGIQFTPANVLEPFSNAIATMLNQVDLRRESGAIGAGAQQAISGAVKQMFRVTIGSFSRRSRGTTRFAPTFEDVSPNAVGRVQPAANGGFVYQVPSKGRPDDTDTWHPEIAALLWGRARTRVLRYAPPRANRIYGALQVEPNKLIGIQGDAIYTTEPEPWTYPVARGGIDDGTNGRIRIKGYLPGPLEAPLTLEARQELSRKAEENGWE